MLCYVKTDSDGSGIAVADLEISVAHRRVEGAGVGIGYIVTRRHGAGWWKGDWATGAGGLSAGQASEHDHDAHAFLKAGSIGRQDEDGPRCAIPNQAHTGPDVDS